MRVRYRNLSTGLSYLLGLTIILIGALLFLFSIQKGAIESTIRETIKTDLRAYTNDLDDEIAFVASDVLLLEEIIVNRDIFTVDGSGTTFKSNSERDDLAEDILDWVSSHRIYDQIRIIDNTGQEIIRANNNNNNPMLVDYGNLQDKSGRYYFDNAIGLDNDVLYLSNIDLNIENGEIEYVNGEPKEMLRIGTTLYDINNVKIGVLIVNYFAGNIFHDEEDWTSSYTNFEVINEDGYYLHSIRPDIEYGFMFDDKNDEVFSKYHEYDIVKLSENEVTQVDDKNEIYTSILINSETLSETITKRVGRDIGVYNDNGSLIVFGEVILERTDQVISLTRTYFVTGFVLLFVALGISRLIDEVLFSRKQHLDVLEFTSTHDLLTGLPNRAQLFEKRKYFEKEDKSYTVMFMDFDGFKLINDQYGHAIGDKVLIEGSRRIKSCIRDTDLVARIGGDEFLVILDDVTDDRVINRVNKNIEEQILTDFIFDGNKYNVGLSVGIAKSKGSMNFEEIINLADQRMYEIKNAKKSSR